MDTNNISTLTHARVRELLNYDESTGLFTWRVSRKNNQVKVGDVAGHLNKKLGYLLTNIDGVPVYLHRLVWFWVHGVWPSFQIDHINRVRSDNRLVNLRDVPRKINVDNSAEFRVTNTSGVRGVSWHKQRGKWCARINGSYLGVFDDIGEAKGAYETAREGLAA